MKSPLFASALIAVWVACISCAHAQMFVQGEAAKRGSLPVLQLQDAPLSIVDPENDLSVFDGKNEGRLPTLLVDVQQVDMSLSGSGWLVVFQTYKAVPNDPGMPVNFNVFIDPPHHSNALWRGEKLTCMLLFGTKTKWHTECWTADKGATMKKIGTIPYTVESERFTMLIPFAFLSKQSAGSVHFVALTSNNFGSDAIDIAPGTLLPSIIMSESFFSMKNVFIGIVVLFILSLWITFLIRKTRTV